MKGVMQKLRDDRGGINFVKLFLILVVASVGYASWVYVPLWLDHMAIRKAVRTACNVAYGQRREDAVIEVILNGFRETKLQNEAIALDGTIISRPLEYSEALFEVRLSESPPSITVDLEYEQQIVLPLFKKPRTLVWRYSHTEDLSPIKY